MYGEVRCGDLVVNSNNKNETMKDKIFPTLLVPPCLFFKEQLCYFTFIIPVAIQAKTLFELL